jgi:hypothetical protein
MARRIAEPLTTEMVDSVVQVLRVGVTYTEAAAVIGVPRGKLHSWIDRGRLESDRLSERGGKPKASEAIYFELYHRVVKAKHDAHILLAGRLMEVATKGQTKTERRVTTHPDGTQTTTVITTQYPPSASVAQWILSRRYPEIWSEHSDLYRMVNELREQVGLPENKHPQITERTTTTTVDGDYEEVSE